MIRLPDTPATGVAIMTAAMIIAPLMDMFSKLLSQSMSPGQITVGRFLVQTLLLLPLVLVWRQWRLPGRLHLVAGGLLGFGLLSINTALQTMPVANVIAIFFVEPLILTLLSAAILGERLGAWRLGAVLLGLVGALVVIRPNWAAYGVAAILPVVTATCFAFYLLITRVLAPRGGPLAMQFWIGIFAMLSQLGVVLIGAQAGIAMFALAWPGAWEIGLLIGMGSVAALSHQLLTQAFARAEAGLLAPLQYLEILSAVAIGWWVFGDIPDWLTACGTAIIIAAGMMVFRRATPRENAGLQGGSG